MNKKLAFRRCGLMLFLALLGVIAVAQNSTAQTSKASIEPFTLRNGDRVVFLGNSLMENDLLYGYLELALTTRWPDRNVTFRNIGWSGDTVFGDARSYFTNPPTPYELLMKQITDAQPTVVFVAYGGVEAQEGEAGLARFNEGLNQLLDKIEELGAKAVLLSPIPVLSSVKTDQRNAMLQRYAASIATTAAMVESQLKLHGFDLRQSVYVVAKLGLDRFVRLSHTDADKKGLASVDHRINKDLT